MDVHIPEPVKYRIMYSILGLSSIVCLHDLFMEMLQAVGDREASVFPAELDHSVITVVMGFGSTTHLFSPPEKVAMTLGSLDSFIRNRKLQMTPLNSITLPNQVSVDDPFPESSVESYSTPRRKEPKLFAKFRSFLEKSSANSAKVKVSSAIHCLCFLCVS